MLAAIGVDHEADAGRPGPVRLLLVAAGTTLLSLVVLGVLAFALEGRELQQRTVEPGPPPVVDAGPLRDISLSPLLVSAVEPVIAACHLSASPRDAALRADVEIDVEVEGGRLRLGDGTGASPFFHGCLRRRSGELEVDASLRGKARLVGRVTAGRATLTTP